jgi:hypothetical protein
MMSKKQPSADTTPTAPDNTNGFSGLDCATSCPLTTETNDASGKEINLVKIALWITVLVVVPGGIALYLLKKK